MKDKEFTLEWAVGFIANRIRIFREEKGVSAQTMSIELGHNKAYINKIENQVSKISIEGLYNICDYLGITFSEFFYIDIKRPDIINELLNEAKDLEPDSLQMLIDISKKIKQK